MEKAPLHSKLLEGVQNNLARPWHLWFDKLWSVITGISETIAGLKFTDLSDTPSAYTGQAGKVVKVNVGETGLEFGVGGGGVSAHNDLTGIQGGTAGEYYHLTSADNTELTGFANGGTSTHTELDSEKTASSSHRADSTIHFTQAQIDHVNILNKGTNTHAQIDTAVSNSVSHIANSDIHKSEIDEIESTYVDGIEDETVYSLANTPVKTLSYTYDSSDRVATISNGVKTWTFEYYGTGEFKRGIKT